MAYTINPGKIVYPPDWDHPFNLLVSQGKDGKKLTQAPDVCAEKDWYTLRARLEIRGGGCLFETFKTAEDREKAAHKRALENTWRIAVNMACLFMKAEIGSWDMMVMYAPESEGEKERIWIYEKFERPF